MSTLPVLHAFENGEERSKEQLFEEVTGACSSLVSRIAFSYERDYALRRELVQDILLAIWLALPTFRGESSLRTFVAGIAQKRAISHVTRRAREPRQIELPPDLRSGALAPDELMMENDRRRELTEAIHRLPIPQREAIVLWIEDFSYAEMGQALGISANAAMLRCQRAKASLRAHMGRGSD